MCASKPEKIHLLDNKSKCTKNRLLIRERALVLSDELIFAEYIYKPDSVFQISKLTFETAIIYLMRSTRQRRDKVTHIACMNLHPVRFTMPSVSRQEAVSSYLTFSPLLQEAVYFLLYFLYLPKQTLSYAYWIAEHGTCWCPDFPP